MGDQGFVVLLGDSVLMEGLGDSLRSELALRVVWVDQYTADLTRQLSALKPDLIVVDLDTQQPSIIVTLLREFPGTFLLGIDHSTSQVVVLNSNCYPIRSMHEFCTLAQTELDCEVESQKGGIN